MISCVIYDGNLRTTSTHLQSGSTFETDAPTDNQGLGARFSPTDLIGTALAACILTTMAIRARALEGLIQGVRIDVEKIMSAHPRRISGLHLTFHYPPGFSATAAQQSELEHIAMTCPVKESLHPGIDLQVDFNWPNS